MAHDVFISYTKQDKLTADALCNALESQGLRCWIAPRDVPLGAEWAEAIMDAIDRSRVMALVFSSHANASKHVQREVHQAFDTGLTVVTLRVEEVVPRKGLDYYMASVHWLDAFTPPMEVHLKKLAAEVRALLDVPTIRPDSPPATEGPDRPSPPPEDRREASATAPGRPAASAPREPGPHRLRIRPRRLAISCSVVLFVGIFAFVLAGIYYPYESGVADQPGVPVATSGPRRPAEDPVQPDEVAIHPPRGSNPGSDDDGKLAAPPEMGPANAKTEVPRRNGPAAPTSRHLAGDPVPSKAVPHGEVPASTGPSEKAAQAREVHVPHMGLYYEPVMFADGTFGARLTRDPAPNTPAGQIRMSSGVSHLERGDMIIEMDGQRFRTPDDVRNHRFETTIRFVNVRTGEVSDASFSLP